jgi:hypothetical protein
MYKLLTLLFSIVLIGCSNQPKLLNNGLTKEATQIIEYSIKVEKDSLKNIVKDTLVITEKKYNDNNLITKRVQQNLFENDRMEIQYEYNENNKIQREIVKLSNDSLTFIVDYFYKDTLLYKSYSETENNIFRFKQIEEYEYNSDKSLIQKSLTQEFIELETNDTLKNTIEISKYNKKELVSQSILKDFMNPEKELITKYVYDCGRIKEMKEYNNEDSLISKTEYKYELDEFQNWFIRESFVNKELKFLNTRIIQYK